jgi:hypothetical protein
MYGDANLGREEPQAIVENGGKTLIFALLPNGLRHGALRKQAHRRAGNRPCPTIPRAHREKSGISMTKLRIGYQLRSALGVSMVRRPKR